MDEFLLELLHNLPLAWLFVLIIFLLSHFKHEVSGTLLWMLPIAWLMIYIFYTMIK